MIKVEIPGKGILKIDHIVFDVNGTLAVDGVLIPGVAERFQALKKQVKIHLLTADTHGKQEFLDKKLNLTAIRIKSGDEKEQKAEYIKKIGPDSAIAVGQGANDALMVKQARIGICVLSAEGAALETMLGSDLIVPDITSALDILLNPIRLKASLRE